jgi:hypothetical protein
MMNEEEIEKEVKEMAYEKALEEDIVRELAFLDKLRRDDPHNNFQALLKMQNRKFRQDRDIVTMASFRKHLTDYFERLEETAEYIIVTRRGTPAGYFVHPLFMGKLFDESAFLMRTGKAAQAFLDRGDDARSEPDVADNLLKILAYSEPTIF